MSADCRDCVLCPFGSSCPRRQITRPGLFVHITSKAHREQLKEALQKRSTLFLRDTASSAPYFEAEGCYISFCFGCQKAWTSQKSDHFPGCKGHSIHLEKMKQLLAEVSGNEAGAEALNAEQGEEILRLKKELEATKKQLEKVKKEYADFEEVAEEDSNNCQLYWGWLKTIIGDPDRLFHTTDAFKEVVEEIAEGERKSLWELSQAPPWSAEAAEKDALLLKKEKEIEVLKASLDGKTVELARFKEAKPPSTHFSASNEIFSSEPKKPTLLTVTRRIAPKQVGYTPSPL